MRGECAGRATDGGTHKGEGERAIVYFVAEERTQSGRGEVLGIMVLAKERRFDGRAGSTRQVDKDDAFRTEEVL
jgi:hypothetical protein